MDRDTSLNLGGAVPNTKNIFPGNAKKPVASFTCSEFNTTNNTELKESNQIASLLWFYIHRNWMKQYRKRNSWNYANGHSIWKYSTRISVSKSRLYTHCATMTECSSIWSNMIDCLEGNIAVVATIRCIWNGSSELIATPASISDAKQVGYRSSRLLIRAQCIEFNRMSIHFQSMVWAIVANSATNHRFQFMRISSNERKLKYVSN